MAETAPVHRRILVVHERYQQAGGEEGVFEAQVELLRRRGHDVETLVVDNDEIGDAPSGLGKVRLAVDTVWSRDGVRRVRAAVQSFRPDVMHAHNTFPLLSPAIHRAARSEGVATVQTLHNFRLICPAAVLYRDGRPCDDCVGSLVAWPGILHACYRGSRAATAAVAAMGTVHRALGTWRRDVDLIVVLADYARTMLVRGGVPRSRVTVVPNFVEPSIVGPSAPGDGYVFVGRLTHDKGVGTLLEAWDRLPPGIPLAIAGTGPMEPAVRAAADRNPAIRALGRLSRAEVDLELSRSRALIVPSLLTENCPLSVLEAFAAGRPVIGVDHSGVAELLDHDRTGWHIRPGDPAGLASAVLAAEADPARVAAAGMAATQAYQERFTPDRGYEALMAVYAQAVGAHRRSGTRPA